jgi:hypothetical protein
MNTLPTRDLPEGFSPEIAKMVLAQFKNYGKLLPNIFEGGNLAEARVILDLLKDSGRIIVDEKKEPLLEQMAIREKIFEVMHDPTHPYWEGDERIVEQVNKLFQKVYITPDGVGFTVGEE